MTNERSSSAKTKAAAEAKSTSGVTERAIPFADALAAVRRRAGSQATGPASDDERAAIDELMASAGLEPEFRPAPIAYDRGAEALGVSVAELRALVKTKAT